MTRLVRIEKLLPKHADCFGTGYFRGFDESEAALAESSGVVAQGTITGVSEPYSRSR